MLEQGVQAQATTEEQDCQTKILVEDSNVQTDGKEILSMET